VQKTRVTFEEFEQFVLLPENADRHFELIDGEIIELAPERTKNSRLGLVLSGKVYQFCEEHKRSFDASGATGAYKVQGHTLAPDFAFKHVPVSDDYPDPEPPLWAVEIISPTDKAPDIHKKRLIYQRAGILLWEIYPQEQIIDVYEPGKSMRSVDIDGTLDVGDILPGFTLAVCDLFAK
jgi:Uma2 family endonuclease